MKRKKIFTLLIAVFMVALAGCSCATDNKEIANTTSQIANPWRYDISKEEIKSLTKLDIILPKEAINITYNALESQKMLEVTFEVDKDEYCVRAKKTQSGLDDISGLYYDWINTEDKVVDNQVYKYRQNQLKTIDNVIWYKDRISYSLYSKDSSEDEIIEIAKQIGAT